MQLTALEMDVDTEKIDKIDMSLDDIIRLNKNLQKTELFNMKAQISSAQQFRSYMDARNMRGQEITKRLYAGKAGHTMHKMSSWNGVSPLKRPPLKVRNSAGLFRRRKNYSRPWNMWNKPTSPMQRYAFSGSYSQASDFRRGLMMRQQRDNRQATYLHRRGLKVQATMEESEELLARNRPNPWRTSVDSSGILTVSIDNPSAVALPSSIASRLPRPPLPFLLKKEDSEIKVPKGVPLDFDINSVAKQTGITLNERFKILKEQRLSQTVSKGSRFVTVG